ncbi:MAG: C-type lectin domain-containing protein [Kiritimatiellae bacterium]|nr:C-type lectin domain-containing protein [Kiritimatiellia bacterium]MDD5519462.1 C-type lectin domain-containing protein [Kiritimatiellia bacterium]
MKKCIVSILAGLITISTLLAQTDSLSVGKLKYESAKARIESDALAAYSNSLVAAMVPLKQKGDLDTFLIVRKELERISVEKTIGSTNSTAGIINLNATRCDVEKSQKVQALTKQYVAYLEGLIKQAMLANKIDDAKGIKAELDRVKFEQADSESKVVKVAEPVADNKMTNAIVQMAQKKKTLHSVVGTWRHPSGYINIFYPDGRIEQKGAPDYSGSYEFIDEAKTKFKRTCKMGAVIMYDYNPVADTLIEGKKVGNDGLLFTRISDVMENDKKADSSSDATTNIPVKVFPKSGKKVGGHYYKIIGDMVTFKEAQEACVKSGGHLVVIDTEEENNLIKDMFVHAKKNLWIGLADESGTGDWMWVDGTKPSFFNWARPFWGGPGKGNCVHMAHLKEPTWQMEPSDTKCGFICEWDK